MLLDLKSTYRILSWLCQSFHSLISKTPLLSKHKQEEVEVIHVFKTQIRWTFRAITILAFTHQL